MIPEKNDPRWREIVISEREFEQMSLASKMMIMRVRAMIKADESEPQPDKINEAIDIAHEYFVNNQESVEEDLNFLFDNI